ncbi:MAG: hypothetical protein QOI11_3732 [Candidatus Eremiobacteraeota bacterium]|nr:hypothetical protein [Candidatus Eremiobacteraeota bacterium]
MTSALLAYLVNGLWQAPLLVLLTAGVLALFRSANATTRYAAWFATLLAILVVPLASTLWLYAAAPHAPAAAATQRTMPAQPGTARPHGHAVPSTTSTTDTASASALSRLPERRAALTVPGALADAAVALWALLALIALVRVAAASFALGKLKRDALPLTPEYRDALPLWNACAASAGGRETRLCVSPDVAVPVAVGLFDGMIVMPDHVLETFTTGDIDRFTLHELAHLRRRDDWTCMAQRLIGALLFFNPLVAFVARRLDLEREVACDDWVVSLTHDVRRYAVGLTRMAEATARGHRPIAAPAVFATRKSLSIRIERLLTRRRDARPRLSASPLTLSVAASVALLAVVAPLAPVVGVAREIAPAAPVPPARVVPVQAARPPSAPRRAQPAAPARAVQKPPRAGAASHAVAVPPVVPAAVARHVAPVKPAAAAPRVVPVKPAAAKRAAPAASARTAVPQAAAHRPRALPAGVPVGVSVAALDRSAELVAAAAEKMGENITAQVDAKLAARPKERTPDFLEALSASGYAGASADDIVALREHGVSAALLLAAGQYFERRPSVPELIDMTSSGVSPAYLRGLAEGGLRRLTPATIIRFTTSGISSAYAVQVLTAVPHATPESVVSLAAHGVSSALIAGLQARGYAFDPALLADLTAHGVSLRYIDGINAHRSGRFALRDVITLHDHGVSAERASAGEGGAP